MVRYIHRSGCLLHESATLGSLEMGSEMEGRKEGEI